MAIAAFCSRVTLQRREVTRDEIQNEIERYSNVYTAFAAVEDEVGQEVQEQTESTDHTRLVVRLRDCKALTNINNSDYRLVFQDDIYNIVGINHMGYKGRFIKLHCVKERYDTKS